MKEEASCLSLVVVGTDWGITTTLRELEEQQKAGISPEIRKLIEEDDARRLAK